MAEEPILCPHNTPLQNRAATAREYDPVPRVCMVTGGTGFVGQRLVEMLVERGAERVISFDIVPPHDEFWRHEAIEYVTGDISDQAAVDRACEGVDCVWHIAAAVGPFHPQDLYVVVARFDLYAGCCDVARLFILFSVASVAVAVGLF